MRCTALCTPTSATCTQPQRLLQSLALSSTTPPTSPLSCSWPPPACLQGYLYQLALTAGLQRARAAPAVAMSYLTIIWGHLSDTLLFHQRPNGVRWGLSRLVCMLVCRDG